MRLSESQETEFLMNKLQKEIIFSHHERLVFKPKDNILVSEWSARHRHVAKGPAVGRWSNDLTPYLVQPMDTWNLPWVKKIYLCFAPQTGKTQVALNCLQYAIDQDPGPAMYIMSSEQTAKRISLRQILPSFKASPRISALLSERADDVSTKAMSFKNGMDLMMAWATSAAGMASESVRYLFMDEPGKYPEFAGREADPFSLAEIRTNAYPHSKKIMYFSTPNLEGDAFSNALEDDVDVTYHYHAECPFCSVHQRMEFDSIHWGGFRDYKTIQRKKQAFYTCTSCGMDWNDAYRDDAVKSGRWVPDKDIDRPSSVAFHLPSWYSPFISLSDVAAAFLKGMQDPHKMQAFVTQHKAEPWKDVVERKDETKILSLKVALASGIVPKGTVALTAGIDMQKHGFWFVVRAWMSDLSSHLVHYGTLSTWSDVETLAFGTRYPVEGGGETMGIWRAGLDTGGGQTDFDDWSRTEEAYEWLRSVPKGVVFGLKGASRPQIQRVRKSIIDKWPGKNLPMPGGLELRLLDTGQFKGVIHWRMGRKEGESQRFTLNSETGIDYASQILAEELRKGRKGTTEWKRIRKDNHLLDCEVYAAACADGEWTPSLAFLAKNEKHEQIKTAPRPRIDRDRNDVRTRPTWYANR